MKPSAAYSSASGKTGRARASISKPTAEPSTISQPWPRRPKPVTSVHAWTRSPSQASAAARFSVTIEATMRSTAPGLARPPLIAVLTIPVPSGLVSTSRSPGLAPWFVQTRSGWTRPVTARPYFSSGSSTVWPPARTQGASRSVSRPPWSTSWRTPMSIAFEGKQAMFIAAIGVPPMA